MTSGDGNEVCHQRKVTDRGRTCAARTLIEELPLILGSPGTNLNGGLKMAMQVENRAECRAWEVTDPASRPVGIAVIRGNDRSPSQRISVFDRGLDLADPSGLDEKHRREAIVSDRSREIVASVLAVRERGIR
jgi:hypothetical protein